MTDDELATFYKAIDDPELTQLIAQVDAVFGEEARAAAASRGHWRSGLRWRTVNDAVEYSITSTPHGRLNSARCCARTDAQIET